jgi:pSer/pThr/pTyr-binding forkhead associated (FHA) protein
MMWVEILSRQRDVISRFRIDGPEARIGRGYDNDVVVEDPYVAAQHLRIFRDEAGQLVAEDVGSINGTFLDGGNSRLARIMVDGTNPIRIGRTYLRVRESSHAVERERIARPERPRLPIILTMALGMAILAILSLDIWLGQTVEARTSSYVTPLLAVIATLLGWVMIWALMSRIFSGRSRFVGNLMIALAGAVAFAVYADLARAAAFAWNLSGVMTYQYVAAWLILGLMCFLHLREAGRSRLWLKGALITALFATAIGVQAMQRSEAFSDSGRQVATWQLMPPSFRAVSFHDQDAFFGGIAGLRAGLDKDRSEPRPDVAGQ